MTQHRRFLTVAPNGRVVIPADVRAELGLIGGDKLSARVVDGALVLEPFETIVRRAQDLVAKYKIDGVSIVDELIAERRAEAARE